MCAIATSRTILCRPVSGSRLRLARRGATDPDISDALDIITDELFNVIGHPYNASSTMATLESELLARWGPTRQHDGCGHFTAYRGTAAAATTYGNARNSEFSTVHGYLDLTLVRPGMGGRAVPARCALSAAADPALPFQTIPLRGILPAPLANRFNVRRARDPAVGRYRHAHGRPHGRRLYRADGDDIPDGGRRSGGHGLPGRKHDPHCCRTSRRVVPPAVRDEVRRASSWRTMARRFGPGQRVVTPSIGARRGDQPLPCSGKPGDWSRTPTPSRTRWSSSATRGDPNRLDFLVPPDLVNQLAGDGGDDKLHASGKPGRSRRRGGVTDG